MNRLAKNLTLLSTATIVISLVFAFQSYAIINLENCVGMWLLDEGSGDIVRDSIGTCEDGVISGATWVDGKIGKALSFDSSSVEIPDTPALNPEEAMSMACWVYVTGSAGQHRDIISKDGESASRQYLITASDVDAFRAHIWTADGSVGYFDGSTTVELETWYHIAQTYDGNTLTLYVNGEEDGSTSLSGNIIVTDQPVRIGGGAIAGAAPYYMAGIIDEVVIFNVALEQEDIQTIMNGGLADVISAVSYAGKLTTTWADIKTR